MAHGPDGVANLVGDAGAEAAQGGQLGLLNPFRQQARIFHKDEHAAVAVIAQRRKTQIDEGGSVRCGNGQRTIIGTHTALPPAPKLPMQSRRDILDPQAGASVGNAQVSGGRAVNQANPVIPVDDHDALAQALNNVVVQLGQIGQVDAALTGEGFAFLDAAAELLHGEGDHEYHGAENARGGILGVVRDAAQTRYGLFAQQRHGGQGGKQKAHPTGYQQAGCADRHDQQTADAAADTAARMHQSGDGQNVYADLGVHLAQHGRPAMADQQRINDAKGQPARQASEEQGRVGGTHQARIGAEKESGNQQRPHHEAKAVENIQHAPGKFAGLQIRRRPIAGSPPGQLQRVGG